MRWVIFLTFLGCLVYSIWAYGQWQDHRWSNDKFMTEVVRAYAAAAVCIIAVGLIERCRGDKVWSDGVRRGFDVITRKDRTK